MKIDSRSLLLLLASLAIVAGCDTSEDPNLLNPPLPDSTSVRVLNLAPADPVDVAFPGFPLATGLAPYQVSEYKQLLLLEQTNLLMTRQGRPRTDTSFNQTLSRGARMTFLIFAMKSGAVDTTLALRLTSGKQEEADLMANGEAQLSFINAIQDSIYYVKIGCQSGDTLFMPSSFAQAPQQITTKAPEVSLYLFKSGDSMPVASARLRPTVGTTTYLIAGAQGGRTRLYVLPTAQSAGPLREAEPETRTTATVELLNALTDGRTISAEIEGGGASITTGLAPLTISPSAEVQACVNPLGDALLVTAAGSSPFKTPIRLTVAGRALVVVHNFDTGVRAIVLNRDAAPSPNGKVYIRGVNAAPSLRRASIAIGAGAPDTLLPDEYRPFGSLELGKSSGYAELQRGGSYPFLLSSSETGRFFNGGIEDLESGYYTLIVVERLGIPTLMIVRDDIPGSPIRSLSAEGSKVTFFNVMSDAKAEFTAGSLQLPPLAYSYVYATVLPFNLTTIGSNAGSTTVDLERGNYMVGAIGSGSSRKLLAFRTPSDSLGAKKAGIHFLNAIPNSPRLAVRINDSAAQPLDTAAFGEPTLPRQLDERQYSIFITSPESSKILARTNGVILTAGRRYLLVIVPKREGSSSTLEYETIWMQE